MSACEFCGDPAGTLLCDGWLGEKTCDRSMCRDCAKAVGVVFVCARPRSKSFSDTRDLCPDCQDNGGTTADLF
jgi:hypothetical protein